jgi:hypothetical protein
MGHDRSFVYALDDPYIHLAIAKNFAFHGVWGITSHEFTSASSSPLWLLLLTSCFKLSGPDLMLGSIWPLVLNLLSSILVIGVLWREALRYFSPLVTTIATIVAVLAIPLPTLIVSGQEHVLHCAVIFLLVQGYARVLTDRNSISQRDWNVMLFLTSIAVLVRYESLFLIAIFGLLLLRQKQYREAFLFVSIATVPAVIFGIISMFQGWPPLPNSIWLKVSPSSSFLSPIKYIDLFTTAPEVCFCLLLLLAVWIWLRSNINNSVDKNFTGDLNGRELINRCSLLIGLIVLHLMLARLGWLFRYEAYLIFACFLVFFPFIKKIPIRPRSQNYVRFSTVWVLSGILGCFLLQRTYMAIDHTPKALINIRVQHLEMARFFQTHFPKSSLALNDIGAVSYLRDSEVLDLFGLANLEVANSRRAGSYDAKAIEGIARARKVEFIAIYPSWFDSARSRLPFVDSTIIINNSDPQRTSEIPDAWIRCAEWELQGPEYSFHIAFFATSEQSASKLRTAMAQFAPSLPPRVICTLIESKGERRQFN